jgi:hypothetical protein
LTLTLRQPARAENQWILNDPFRSGKGRRA